MTMYVVIRKAKLAGDKAELARRLREHAIPPTHGGTGLKGYCGFVSEAGSVVLAGIFDGREAAKAVWGRVEPWIRAKMSDLMPDEPDTLGGELVFHEVVQPQEQQRDRQPSLFAMVRTYHGLPGQTETMHSLVSEHTLPALMQATGFRGFYAFRDEDDPNRAISLTLFNNREDALHSHAQIVGIMRGNLGELAYENPEMEGGETILLAVP
jgi:quinol monooxygenase YgiN